MASQSCLVASGVVCQSAALDRVTDGKASHIVHIGFVFIPWTPTEEKVLLFGSDHDDGVICSLRLGRGIHHERGARSRRLRPQAAGTVTVLLGGK